MCIRDSHRTLRQPCKIYCEGQKSENRKKGSSPVTTQDPHAFAAEWIEAWNTHDLERILAHYDAGVVFLSPLAKQRTGHGRVEGIEALRAYWAAGLAAQPNLTFEHRETLVGLSLIHI